MLAIFDVDGTIIDSQGVEGECYAAAIAAVSGHEIPTDDWARFAEPTSSGIVRELLAGHPRSAAMEDEIRQDFVRRLHEAQPRFPAEFSGIRGIASFFEALRRAGISIAIATGGFRDEAAFKLQCGGWRLDDFPHATSSDTPRRRDIIALAASRAGVDLAAAVYIADGPWDVTASEALGVPMIGVGRRIERLRALGVRYVFRDYTDSAAMIVAILRLVEARGPSGTSGAK